MNDLVEVTAFLIESGNRSPQATSIAILKALSATLRNSLDSKGCSLSDCADWIDLQLDSHKQSNHES